MDYVEFKRHLGKAGYTVNEFADLIEVHPSSISNYSKKGSVPRHYAIIAVALGDAGDRGADFRELLTKYGVRSNLKVSNVTVVSRCRRAPSEKQGK